MATPQLGGDVHPQHCSSERGWWRAQLVLAIALLLGAVGSQSARDDGRQYDDLLAAAITAGQRPIGALLRSYDRPSAPPSAPLTAYSNVWAGIRGVNYVPSFSANPVQTWMDYNPSVVERELGFAGEEDILTVPTSPRHQ